jgi:superfamily I DNA/RNA helicase
MGVDVKITVGCPGAGKSSFLAKTARQFDPNNTLILSYSRSAAASIAAKAGKEYKSSTIHSLCFHDLGAVPQQIMQGKQVDDFCRLIKVPVPNEGYDRYDPSIHQYEIYNYARTSGINPIEAYFRYGDLVDFTFSEYVFFVKSLYRYKEAFGLYEFHDLLEKFDPTDAPDNLLIDEAQDNSHSLTVALERLVATGVKRLWLVGDPNQAIYTYSGADPKWMYHFGGVEEFLEQSYRCPAAVVRKAKSLLDAKFNPTESHGEVSQETSIPDKADMILVRTNYIKHKLIKQLGIDKRIISTIHKAKGMQGDHVVLYNATTRRVRSSTEIDPIAEKRLLYTAITRAKKKLTIVEGKNPNEWI